MEASVKIKKMRDNAIVPSYQTKGAAAVDLCACLDSPVTLMPKERKLIPTGIAISIPEGSVAVVCARSGLSYKKGICASNGIGVIDSDYRGEIFFSAINNSNEPYTFEDGERIAQMMLLPYIQMDFVLSEALDETERGAGGFGSTGK